MNPPGNYQLEIYFQGLNGVLPSLPMAFAELEARAEQAMPPSLWTYVAGGAGDERTQRANITAFERWGLIPRMLVGAIEVYRQMISPLRPPSCRFMPTCSQYAVDAVTEYGAVRGGWLSLVRLAKCGPWNRGGWDPIPERNAISEQPGAGDGVEPELRSVNV